MANFRANNYKFELRKCNIFSEGNFKLKIKFDMRSVFDLIPVIFSVWTAQGPYAVVRNNFVALSDMEVKLMHWYNHCFSYDYQVGSKQNGFLKMEKKLGF